MSFDLSWLWNLLNQIASAMQSWFSSLWTQAQYITNTGQGIFSGLIAFGSQMWDALTKAFSSFGEWIYNAFGNILIGLTNFGNIFGQWVSGAFQWVAGGLQWIATQFYNFGNWIWNSLCWLGDMIRNSLIGLWNWITSAISSMVTSVNNWWNSVVEGINEWFTNLLRTFRQKIVMTVMADIAIAGMWKSGERILNPSSLKDIGYGFLGIALSPIVGYAIGKFIDAIVPLPSTPSYPLIPSTPRFTYEPPSVGIERPSEPYKPPLPPQPPAYGYVPIYDFNLGLARTTYEAKTMGGSDANLSIPSPTYTINSGESYAQGLNLSLCGISYEAWVS